jgi:hypothetical protein
MLPLLAAPLLLSAPEGELRALGGAEPPPLRAPHFPRPLDEYVFRNWGVAPAERIAAAIGARVEDVRSLAQELGLGSPPAITPEIWRRSYLTAIRRNWHLLPYDQLLLFLGWDEARLATTLREDDFLWVKLGGLKPRAPPLSFEPIPEALRPRYDLIRSTVSEVLGPRGLAGFRPRYAFLDDLRSPAEIPRRRSRAADAGEVSLDAGSSIVLPPGAGPVARGAAERFAFFLRNAMGTEMPVLEVPAGPGSVPAPSPAPAAPAAVNVRVVLELAPAGTAGPESHEISVEPGRIVVSAGDEEGLLRGLDRLKDRIEERGGPFLAPGRERRDVRIGLRFLYSYSALYGDPLLEPDLDPYPDGYLEKLSRLGVNGVWLQGVLRNLAPPGGAEGEDAVLREPGGKSARRLESLKALVARARRYGIGIYLYLNEPRALPAALFEKRPELAGVAEGGLRALCTSVPAVREFLSGSLAHVFATVPDLAGVFTISMSENLTCCWSHSGGKACPRCGERPGPEVIAEVNRAVFEGVRRSSQRARVIAWDWGWPDDWVEPIASRLPQGVDLMSVSEWSLAISRAGKSSTVGEYSLSAVGPGPRASRTWEIARRGGRRAVAKIQANNTWELSAVPYIPVVRLVAEHARRLSAAGVDGLMLGWTLGGYPSPNLEAAAQYYFGPPPAVEEAVRRVAARRFGPAGERVERAWKAFGEAFQQFPFHIGLVYNAPLQLGPANLLYARETGYRATMVGFPYDDLEQWRGIYRPEALAEALQSVVQDWEKGLSDLREEPELDGWVQSQVRSERRVAVAARAHWKSTADQTRFVLGRRDYEKTKDRAEALRLLNSLRTILLSEIRSARDLLAVCREDARIGFEASNQYYYVPGDLAEKVFNCRYLLEEWIAVEKKRWEG